MNAHLRRTTPDLHLMYAGGEGRLRECETSSARQRAAWNMHVGSRINRDVLEEDTQ